MFLRALFILAIAATTAPAQSPLNVLIIDGQNNHAWRKTTPYLKNALEGTKRFAVEVSSHLKEGDKAGEVATVAFPPDLNKYQVVISNYNGQPWPEAFQRSFEEQLKSAKVGLVIFHAANNSFPGKWAEFDKMIGMGWRGSSYGDRIYLDDQGKVQREGKGIGKGAGELPNMPFQVAVRDFDHPVTKGMPKLWMHTADQLVHGLRGPAENIHVLATAYSDPKKGKQGTGLHEPILWTVSYGKGRVFHTPMGHDVTSLSCVGFLTAIARGTEWAAGADVTVPVPSEFPTADKTSAAK